MKYIISVDGRDSDPLDVAQVVLLYQSGAIKRNSKLKEEGAEWSVVEKHLPFITGIRTWSELASQVSDQSDTLFNANLRKIDIGFWHLVGFIFKFSLASIPAAIFLWIVFAVLAVVFGGLVGGLAHMR